MNKYFCALQKMQSNFDIKSGCIHIYQICGVDNFLERLKNDLIQYQSGNRMIRIEYMISLLYYLDNPFEFIRPFFMTLISFKDWIPYSNDHGNACNIISYTYDSDVVNREIMSNAMSLCQDSWYCSSAYCFSKVIAMKESQKLQLSIKKKERSAEYKKKLVHDAPTLSKKKSHKNADIKSATIDNHKGMKYQNTDFISEMSGLKKPIVMDHPLYSLIEHGRGMKSLPCYESIDRNYHVLDYGTSALQCQVGDRSNTWSR